MGCYNAVVINRGADDVWGALRSFHDLSWAPNVITDLKPIGDAGATDVGARRVLNDAFHETLRMLDDKNRAFTYSIDDGPGPTSSGNVAGYVGEVRVLPLTVGSDADQCVVVWTSDWVSEEGEGGSVAEFCDPIYRALLSDMKASFG